MVFKDSKERRRIGRPPAGAREADYRL